MATEDLKQAWGQIESGTSRRETSRREREQLGIQMELYDDALGIDELEDNLEYDDTDVAHVCARLQRRAGGLGETGRHCACKRAKDLRTRCVLFCTAVEADEDAQKKKRNENPFC